jgi:SPP1 family holin
MMDKGTIIRTSVLLVALINQFLVIFGKSPLPFSDQEVEQIASVIFTFITALWTWYKNNYVTKKGRAQKEVLERENLLGEKRESAK